MRRGDASTPPLGKDADIDNAAALTAAQGAFEPTVRPAAGARVATLRQLTAATP